MAKLPSILMPRDENGRCVTMDAAQIKRAISIAEKRTRAIARAAPVVNASLSDLFAAAYLQGIMDAALSTGGEPDNS